MPYLRDTAAALHSGELSSVDLLESAITAAKASDSVFISINEGLLSFAEAIDRGRRAGQTTPPLAGIPIALKDLFNVRNETTLAGSLVRKHYAKPEANDAVVVAPLREAGLLFLGRTNLSEFAFSGMGLNPHYGTPLCIWDRQNQRIPGGSSSGSAVSVAEGIVGATLGSDTAGSCRIPAAFNGIVGVKPSFGRLSLQGIYPLSPTSDAPGPMARDLDSCFILDQLMSAATRPADPLPELQARDPASLRLIVPEARVMEDLDDEVKAAFNWSLEQLRDAGAVIVSQAMPVLDQCIDLFNTRAIALYEAYQHHQEMLENHLDEYDPFVSLRLLGGRDISESEQQSRYRDKRDLATGFNQQFDELSGDAIVYPSAAYIPPLVSSAADLEKAKQINLRCLRNTSTANYFDGCSISLPCHEIGKAPVGFMLSAKNGDDDALYRVAAAVEACLNQTAG